MNPESPDVSRVLVASADTHVAPPLYMLREYCASEHLEAFDAFVQATQRLNARLLPNAGYREYGFTDEQIDRTLEASQSGTLRNCQGTGTFDMSAREADMDFDGVASEIIFHGSENKEGSIDPLPFVPMGGGVAGQPMSAAENELAIHGCWIFNRWLANFCSANPNRHGGICQVPIWDIDESIRIVKWAAEHGFRGMNFPAPQLDRPAYEDPIWDPLFEACAGLNMPIVTHIGTFLPPFHSGPAAHAILIKEVQLSGPRNLWHLIFSGVFDRHPGLRFMLTEVAGDWWIAATEDMDDIYYDSSKAGPILREFLQHEPSHYVRNNVYFGESFMAPHEARAAIRAGLADRVMWGSDYPHSEGTWLYFDPKDPGRKSTTRMSLANTFAGLDEESVRNMAGMNFVEFFGLDRKYLESLAQHIGPTVEELLNPPADSRIPPPGYVGRGFRRRNWDAAGAINAAS